MIDPSLRKPLPWLLLSATLLVACSPPTPVPGAVGFTASDRLELVADRSEPIAELWVSEGADVTAGQVLLVLDGARLQARLDEARAQRDRAVARLEELEAGPRLEAIAEQRARLTGARQEAAFRGTELQRLRALLERELISPDAVDQAKAALDAAVASREAAAAGLAELEAGTRTEQLRQAQADLAAAQAAVVSVELDADRLSVRAPQAGVIDSLPFERGEQPAAGQVVAVLLIGDQVHARVYVPEEFRVRIMPGTLAQVRVDGLDQTLSGEVGRIESSATFTPYFALTERDRGRLSYIAEVRIKGLARRLPDGIPVEVSFPGITDAGAP